MSYIRGVLPCAAVLAASVSVAADLEWRYEGSSPEPVKSTAASAAPAAVETSPVVTETSEAYGTDDALFFRSFASSSGECALGAVFRSSKPIGMMVILK